MTAIASKLSVSTVRARGATRAARVSAKVSNRPGRPGLVMPRQKKAVRKKDPGTYLSMYFRDMAALDVLRPEEEFVAAREIEGLELALWRQLLGFAPALDTIAAAVEAAGAPAAELRVLRKAAGAPGKNGVKLVRAIDKAATRLREADQDKI